MSTTSGPDNALLEALRRKTNHQAERIDELETTVAELEADIVQLKRDIAEVER